MTLRPTDHGNFDFEAYPAACIIMLIRPVLSLTVAVVICVVTKAQLAAVGSALTPSDVDIAFSAQLAWLASSRAPPVGANTAAVITHGSVPTGAVMPTSGLGFIATTSAPITSSWQESTMFTAALLANGCLMDTQMRYGLAATTPLLPFVCPPAGLGSRFVSVLRGPTYVGGVTDVGTLVLFGPLTGSGERCAYIRGPFTAMAALQRLYAATGNGAVRVVPSGEDLCALDRAGVLHCWADLPASWLNVAPRWQPAAPGQSVRPSSACLDMAGNATFLRPSPRQCARAAAATAAAATAGTLANASADCPAPVLLASFSISPCGPAATGAYIVGVRAADSLPVAWLVGGDSWEDEPPPGSLAVLPTGLFNASGAQLAVDPRLPPVWRCTDTVGLRMFVGRAADGSGYFEEPEARVQGIGGLAAPSRRRLNSSAVRLSPTGALWSMSYGYLNINTLSNACGPFAPFSFAYSGQAVGYYVIQASPGIRSTDASLQLPGHEQSHLLPASPVSVAHLVLAPRADMVCASFAAPAAAHAGTGFDPTWEVKCAGPP